MVKPMNKIQNYVRITLTIRLNMHMNTPQQYNKKPVKFDRGWISSNFGREIEEYSRKSEATQGNKL